MYITGFFDVGIICLGIVTVILGIITVIYARHFFESLEKSGINQADLRKKQKISYIIS